MQPKGRFLYGMQFIPQDSTFRPKILGVQDPSGDGVGSARVTIFDNTGTPVDAYNYVDDGVEPDSILATGSFLYGLDEATNAADRIRAFGADADSLASPALGLLGSVTFQFGFNGSTWSRVRIFANNADNVAVVATGLQGSAAFGYVFDGTTADRSRSQSATNVVLAQQIGVALAAPPGNWSITHTPAANTQATITRAAGGAGVRHICTSISARLIADEAIVSGTVQVNLRDGATGVGTILWSETLKVGGAASITAENAEIKLSGLSIPGSANTAMTWEFSAAGGAGTVESVAITGYDVA